MQLQEECLRTAGLQSNLGRRHAARRHAVLVYADGALTVRCRLLASAGAFTLGHIAMQCIRFTVLLCSALSFESHASLALDGAHNVPACCGCDLLAFASHGALTTTHWVTVSDGETYCCKCDGVFVPSLQQCQAPGQHACCSALSCSDYHCEAEAGSSECSCHDDTHVMRYQMLRYLGALECIGKAIVFA